MQTMAPATRTTRSFLPTERDRQIVGAVASHRALTSDQIALLLWGEPKASSRCRLRLRLLTQSGYLERVEQPVTLAEGRRPLVYFLGEDGVPLALEIPEAEEAARAWKKEHRGVGWPFLDHLLATNDIRIRLTLSAQQAGFTLLEWLDDASLAARSIRDQFSVITVAGRRETWAVGPDGYASFLTPDGGQRHRVFIEADRATVPLARWQVKVEKYLAYFASAAFRGRYGASKPFRVLTVTTGPERLANMRRITAQVPGAGPWFWFATYEAISDPARLFHEPLWLMAGGEERAAFPYPSPFS